MITRETTIWCDKCGTLFESGDGPREILKEACANGWTRRIVNGKALDLCYNCSMEYDWKHKKVVPL